MSMENYYLNFPSDLEIMKILEQAGADENTQIAGVLWLKGVVCSVAKAKRSREDVDRLSEFEKHISAALKTVERIKAGDPATFGELLSTHELLMEGGDMVDSLNAIIKSCEAVEKNSPQLSLSKHGSLISNVFRFLECENLNANFSNNSPAVQLISAITGESLENIARSVSRYRNKEGQNI